MNNLENKAPTIPEISKEIISDIPRTLTTIHQIQMGTMGEDTRSFLVNSVLNKIKTRAKNPANAEELLQLIDYIEAVNTHVKELGGKDVVGTRSPIWKLRETLRVAV